MFHGSVMLMHANLAQVMCVGGAAVGLRGTNKESNIQNAQQWHIHICSFEIHNQSQHRLIQTPLNRRQVRKTRGGGANGRKAKVK